MKQGDDGQEDELMTEEGGPSEDDPESEEVAGSNDGESLHYKQVQRGDNIIARPKGKFSDLGRHERSPWASSSRPWHGEEDCDMDADGNSYPDEGGPVVASKSVHGVVRRTRPVGLADLDSPNGR